MGKSTTEAVQVLFDRMPLPEVNFFVVVITVQQQAGGNLSRSAGQSRRVLRNRKKMKQKIKAMSSEAKASAGIIGSLPFIVGHARDADHAELPGAAVHHADRARSGSASPLVMMSLGVFIMNRMIQFDF